MMKDDKSLGARIPVTIVSGFLGSGKTTLINNIISQNNGLKIGIVVNDFGEIDIDSDLIVSSTNQLMEISNGCICCSNNGDLRASIQRLIEQNTGIDYIVIESTGIGDPLPILKTFLRPEFIKKLRVDSVITVVDCENIHQSLIDSPVAKNQILFADFILLNKCDLIDASQIARVKDMAHNLNHRSRVLETVKCFVPLSLILGIMLHDSMIESNDQIVHDHICDHDCDRRDKVNHGFKSVAFKSDRLIDPHRFQTFLQNLPANIFRAKGFIKTSQSEENYIFHLIAARFTLDPINYSQSPCNKLVFIGQEVNNTALLNALKECLI